MAERGSFYLNNPELGDYSDDEREPESPLTPEEAERQAEAFGEMDDRG